jgi:hypothetical protein
MKQLGSHWLDFHEIWHFVIFRKPADKIQVSFKPDKNNGYFTGHKYTIFIIYRSFLLRMGILQITIVDKIKKHI